MNETVVFGQFGMSVVISVILGVIFKRWENPDGSSSLKAWKKTWIACAVGMIFGLIGMVYMGIVFSAKNVILYLITGFMTGTTSIGMFEIMKNTPGLPVGPQGGK